MKNNKLSSSIKDLSHNSLLFIFKSFIAIIIPPAIIAAIGVLLSGGTGLLNFYNIVAAATGAIMVSKTLVKAREYYRRQDSNINNTVLALQRNNIYIEAKDLLKAKILNYSKESIAEKFADKSELLNIRNINDIYFYDVNGEIRIIRELDGSINDLDKKELSTGAIAKVLPDEYTKELIEENVLLSDLKTKRLVLKK
jgi:hypothetical protein